MFELEVVVVVVGLWAESNLLDYYFRCLGFLLFEAFLLR